jgi:hypothetical protein
MQSVSQPRPSRERKAHFSRLYWLYPAVDLPMERSSMAICPRTGITIPECSCNACLEAQIRRHRPAAGEPEIRITRTPRGPGGRQPDRRAA